ncbi:hypothetical protein QA642_16560 [Bradyrhizobium sp. CB2312]|nr:hypothetical protein [Bradyrhizobium sp. CB2312]WFU75501.1 hypothetical protein QA642_16560 [Bradyrhizobium sp. CB2312]
MFSAETTAVLRAVLEEVCENIPVSEIGARTHVASKILEAAAQGHVSTDALRTVGHKALNQPTTLRRFRVCRVHASRPSVPY